MECTNKRIIETYNQLLSQGYSHFEIKELVKKLDINEENQTRKKYTYSGKYKEGGK